MGDAGARHYRFEDKMLPATHRAETIKVRDSKDVTIDVVETRHGPVIAGDPTKGTALALKVTWTWESISPGRSVHPGNSRVVAAG